MGAKQSIEIGSDAGNITDAFEIINLEGEAVEAVKCTVEEEVKGCEEEIKCQKKTYAEILKNTNVNDANDTNEDIENTEIDSDSDLPDFKYQNKIRREQKIYRKRDKFMMNYTFNQDLRDVIYHRTAKSYYTPLIFDMSQRYFQY